MSKLAHMLHDIAACVQLRTVANEKGEVTNAAIRRAYGNSQSSYSRINRLIELGMIEKIERNRYRLLID